MSGLLGKKITTGAMLEIARVPNAITYAAINILISNPSSVATPEANGVEIFIADAGSAPGNVDLIEPGAIIPAKGKLEWNCRLVSPGEVIYVRAPSGYVVRVESADEIEAA